VNQVNPRSGSAMMTAL